METVGRVSWRRLEPLPILAKCSTVPPYLLRYSVPALPKNRAAPGPLFAPRDKFSTSSLMSLWGFIGLGRSGK